jgi:hypothetical protein
LASIDQYNPQQGRGVEETESLLVASSCQQEMLPATGFPCPRLPSPGDRRHPIDHSVPFEDPKRVTKEGV